MVECGFISTYAISRFYCDLKGVCNLDSDTNNLTAGNIEIKNCIRSIVLCFLGIRKYKVSVHTYAQA